MFFLATKRSQQPCDLISLWNWSHSFILKRVTNTCVQLLGSSLRLQLYTVAMFVLVDYGSTAIEAQMFNSNVTCDILLAAIAKQCASDLQHFSRSTHAHLSHLLQQLEDEREAVPKKLEQVEEELEEAKNALECTGADAALEGGEPQEGDEAGDKAGDNVGDKAGDEAGDEADESPQDDDPAQLVAQLEAEKAGLLKDQIRLEKHCETRQAQLDALQEGMKKFKGLPTAVVDLGDESGHVLGMADKPRERASSIVQSKKTYTLSRRDADSGDHVPLVFTLPPDPVDDPDEPVNE